MLELFILYTLSTRMGVAVAAKGRPPLRYQLLLILFWFGGQLAGAILAVMTLTALDFEEFDLLFIAYIAALFGAAMGAWLVFQLVARLPDPETRDWAHLEADAIRRFKK
jgi:hypothetical protein